MVLVALNKHMKYEIRYSGPRAERLARAYADAVEYNNRGVDILEAAFRTEWGTARTLETRKRVVRMMYFTAPFAGIDGYPVYAIMKHALQTPSWRVLSYDRTTPEAAR